MHLLQTLSKYHTTDKEKRKSWQLLNSKCPYYTQTKKITTIFQFPFDWLTELTRQITPPTKNGHAPPPIESRKNYQSVSPTYVWTWSVFLCWVKLSHRIHILWCPSVNSFKFQPCDHTPPGTQMLWFLIRCRASLLDYGVARSLAGIVYSWDYDGIWSSSIPQLSFLIKEYIRGERFRIC